MPTINNNTPVSEIMHKTTISYKNGRGRLFRNDSKTKEGSPDYSGKGKLPDGREIRIVGWRENNYLNLSFEFIVTEDEEQDTF